MVLRLQDLVSAIQYMSNREDVVIPDPATMAEHIIGFFGYSERIIDNVLYPRDRDMFYQLENLGLLRTVQEETTLPDGRDWRVHYWALNMDKMDLHSEESAEGADDGHAYSKIYEDIPAEYWHARAEA